MILSRITGSLKIGRAGFAQLRMMSSSEEVVFNSVKSAGVITLNKPKSLNALNLNMVREIYPKLKKWENSKSFVIIKGTGEKSFCAGGDVVSVVKAIKEGGDMPQVFFREEYQLNCLIGTYQIPYVALIDGITMGGGVGLSVHGTHRVATERTMFAMPETAIGLFPDVGGSYFLPRLGGGLGMFLALTGQRLKGGDVLKAGIATHLCDASRINELEDELCSLDSPYPEDIAQVLDKYSAEATFKDKEFVLKPHMNQITKCFTAKSVEEIISNLEKDGSEWAVKQLELLNKMSPTSLKITFEQIERGAHLTLQDCLSMEYRLTQRCCEDNDFYEGVRALLLEKDNSPAWVPKSLDGVTQERIDRYFSNLPDERELVL